MKILFFFPLLICLFLQACSSNNAKTILAYNDQIIKQVYVSDSVIQQLFAFKDFNHFAASQTTYLEVLQAGKNQLLALKPFKNDDTLRLAAIQLIDTYSSIVEVDYKAVYSIMHDSLFSAADSVIADSLMFEMYAKWQIESEHVASIQKRFAERHALNLIKK